MASERNAPCYCGSGKKYKHCHLNEDRKRAQAKKVAQLTAPAPSLLSNVEAADGHQPKKHDPEVERLNQLYDRFEAAQYKDRIAIVRSAIAEAALDDELTFHFFNELYPSMVKRSDRAVFADLVALLQSNQPEMYAKENRWFWSWEITNALALDDNEALQQAAHQLIKNGGQDLDQFFPAFNCLLYHDCRAILLEAMNKDTPQIEPEKYLIDAEYEANQKLGDFIVLNYIETHTQEDLLQQSNFDRLCIELASYTNDLQRDALAAFIGWTGGLTSHQWTMKDFTFQVKPQRQGRFDDDEEADPAVAHLRNLSYEFLYYARHSENIPLTKADLAREHLVIYILERHWGELRDETTSSQPRRKSRSRKGRKKDNKASTHVLLPDPKTLDQYLLQFYGFLANGTYEGAAFFELIPTWTRFLRSKALVTEDEGVQALRRLQALSQSLVQIMKKVEADPILAMNMEKWRQNAGI